MKEEKFSLKSSDDIILYGYKWYDENYEKPNAIIQIIHGSVEHAYRYKVFAKELIKFGFYIYSLDQRGHGKTAEKNGQDLLFSLEDRGWEKLVLDQKILRDYIGVENIDIPIFMIGHSMGSIVLRDYISKIKLDVKGVILSGSTIWNKSGDFAIFISDIFKRVYSQNTYSPFLTNLVFGTLNNKIKNSKTKYDFLSRDELEVQKYIDDKYCGNVCTIEYISEMLRAAKLVEKKITFQKTSENENIFIISGGNDPCGGYKVKKIYENYKNNGIKNVSYKVYEGARHELLNELNKEEVYKDIINWIKILL